MDASSHTVTPSERRIIEPAALPQCHNTALMQKTRPVKAQFRGADPVDDTLMVAER